MEVLLQLSHTTAHINFQGRIGITQCEIWSLLDLTTSQPSLAFLSAIRPYVLFQLQWVLKYSFLFLHIFKECDLWKALVLVSPCLYFTRILTR